VRQRLLKAQSLFLGFGGQRIANCFAFQYSLT
jgi:hypothetical protein